METTIEQYHRSSPTAYPSLEMDEVPNALNEPFAKFTFGL